MKLIGITVVLSSFYLLVILGYSYYWHRVELKQLSKTVKKHGHFDSLIPFRTQLRLSYFRIPRSRQGFDRFKRKKQPGKIRIGCFGDTGAESNFEYGYDYPSLLQKKLKQKGFKNVEVLDFSVRGYSFHQRFILWNEVGRHYELDYVIFGPNSLSAKKDLRLRHPALLLPHARYVLDGDGIKLVEVPGEDQDEIIKNYHRFFPTKEVLRYGRSAPSFMRNFFPGLHEGTNPFYYTGLSREDETFEVFKRLLAEVAKSGTKVIVGTHKIAVDPGFKFVSKQGFPYVGLGGKSTPLENQRIADAYFDVLTGTLDSRDVLISADLRKEPKLRTLPPFYSLRDFGLHVNGKPIGFFWELGSKKSSSVEQIQREQDTYPFSGYKRKHAFDCLKVSSFRFSAQEWKLYFGSIRRSGQIT